MTAGKRRKAGKATKPVKTMADYAMSFDRLGLEAERAKSTSLRHPQATSLSMLDGAVAAVEAGPASIIQKSGLTMARFKHAALRPRRVARHPDRR